MKLLNKFVYNRLVKGGYSKEQAEEIVKLTDKYPRAIEFIDITYSADDIKEIHKLFDAKDLPLLYAVLNLDPEKRLMIAKTFNNRANIPLGKATRTWELIFDIANNYDAEILKTVLDKSMIEKPDYAFLGLIRTTMDQEVNLHDLDVFKKEKTRKK